MRLLGGTHGSVAGPDEPRDGPRADAASNCPSSHGHQMGPGLGCWSPGGERTSRGGDRRTPRRCPRSGRARAPDRASAPRAPPGSGVCSRDRDRISYPVRRSSPYGDVTLMLSIYIDVVSQLVDWKLNFKLRLLRCGKEPTSCVTPSMLHRVVPAASMDNTK